MSKTTAPEKRYDVVALGELLIDFTESGSSPQGHPLFEANPGGAPCNVLAMLSRLGRRTAFLGKVGDDGFGAQLRAAVTAAGIDAGGLVADPTVPTTLAFVQTLAGGERSFSFYRSPGADTQFGADELDEARLRTAKIFHFGSLSMTDARCREATEQAIALARKAGALLSFDPNLREPLWRDLEEARRRIRYGISQCDILKISDNEIAWLTDEPDCRRAARKLRGQFDLPLLLVTLGAQGSLAYSGGAEAFVPALPVQTVETTGAGDTFCGCALDFVLTHGLRDYTPDELTALLRFANAAAALITTRKGALSVMPTPAEIAALLQNAGASR